MIRRLVVPPFEALEPFLPRRAGSDPATRETVRAHPGRRARRGATRRCGSTPVEFDGVDLAPADVGARLAATGRRRSAGSTRPLRAALEPAVDRVRAYHEHQREPGFHLTEADGSVVGHEGDAARPGRALRAGRQGVVSVLRHHERGARRWWPGCRRSSPWSRPAGVTDAVLAACALSGRHPDLPDRRGPGDRRAGLRHRDGPAGGQDRRARATAGWRRPSGRWWARWAST